MQTWYDDAITPLVEVDKLVKALYDRLTWGAAHHGDLEAYLDHLPPQAGLVQHRPPDAEIEFWQAIIDDCRQRLHGLLPVTKERLEARPLRYLPFLWRALTVIEAPIEGEVGPNEQQKQFNLLPQIHNQAPFIQVTMTKFESPGNVQ